MLQKDHLFEWRTIWQNVLLGLEIQKRISRKTMEHTEEMLKDYGLLGFKQARPSQLSGGMRQRAALIRTLALDPDLLLFDEPFSALDYQTRLSVCDDIAGIIRKEKKTALLVTHDLAEAISMAAPGDRPFCQTGENLPDRADYPGSSRKDSHGKPEMHRNLKTILI